MRFYSGYFFLLFCFAQPFGFLFDAIAQTNPPPSGRLALLDAVRFTLAGDPVIKLEEQTVKAAQGQLRAAAGEFDTTIRAGLDQASITNRWPPVVNSFHSGRIKPPIESARINYCVRVFC